MTLDKVGDIFPLLTKHLAYAKQKGIPRLFINATILSFFLSFLSATRRYLFFFSFPFKNTSRKDKVKFKKEFSYSSSNRYKRKSIAIIYVLSLSLFLFIAVFDIYMCIYIHIDKPIATFSFDNGNSIRTDTFIEMFATRVMNMYRQKNRPRIIYSQLCQLAHEFIQQWLSVIRFL